MTNPFLVTGPALISFSGGGRLLAKLPYENRADADFLIALNPQTSLVLIGRIRELEVRCERLDGLIIKDGD